MSRYKYMVCVLAGVGLGFVMESAGAPEKQFPEGQANYHLGRVATDEDIHGWNIDVAPDGSGLPAGQGSAKEGAVVYAEHCAGCHGLTGIEGPNPRLVGGQGTLSTSHPVKTVGSYWPYVTTIYDYIYRAMPYTAPQSLTPNQVYSLVAWLLFRNGLIEEGFILDRESLLSVRMPNRGGFVADSRPDVPRDSLTSSWHADLGEVDFLTSGSDQAQPHFYRGVLLLHNFEYEDAAEAFRQAQSLDADFAMAYWGEAMTYHHPLWGEQDRDAARAVLTRLGPTENGRQAKAPTDREKAYLNAIEQLFGDGEKPDRDHAYEMAMGGIAVEYPRDLEARVFYALAILGSAEGKREGLAYLKAGAIAESVFHDNPRHPGAVHYIIHAYDDPKHAFRALQAARIYGTLASAAPHAQHMPSHIYMALGMWSDVVRANELAWKTGEDRIRRKGLGVEARSYHTLSWLMYAYLQEERYAEAKRILGIIEADSRMTQATHVKDQYASMRATYIIEAQAWDTQGVEDDRTSLRFASAVSELFAIGLSAVRTSDPVTAKRALALIRNRVANPSADIPASQVVAGQVSLKELEGLISLSENQTERGMALLNDAVALQAAIPYEYGPPFPIKPAHELLGEALLKAGRTNDARKHFEAALVQAPKRALSLKGLAQVQPSWIHE